MMSTVTSQLTIMHTGDLCPALSETLLIWMWSWFRDSPFKMVTNKVPALAHISGDVEDVTSAQIPAEPDIRSTNQQWEEIVGLEVCWCRVYGSAK